MNIDMKRNRAKDVEDAQDGRPDNKRNNYQNKSKLNPELKTKQSPTLVKPREMECDPAILQRRQKQIDYGKNTVGYHNYVEQVPFDHRSKEDPKTPDKYTKYSRRSWDMLIKTWRKDLHTYDKSELNDNDSVKDDFDIDGNLDDIEVTIEDSDDLDDKSESA